MTFTTFTACDDDDDNFTYYADMATVKELDGQWILQSDNCGKLVPDNSSIIKLNDAAKDGQRVIAAFNFFLTKKIQEIHHVALNFMTFIVS